MVWVYENIVQYPTLRIKEGSVEAGGSLGGRGDICCYDTLQVVGRIGTSKGDNAAIAKVGKA
jgi:hypothetical protein